MRSLRIIATAGLLLTPCALAAQEPVDSDPPAHVSFVDGTAIIERDGKTDTAPTNMPLLAGDRIRTESGRVEILYADGSTLHIDNFTTVDFQSDELVRLLDGRVRLTIAGRPRDVGYRIDGPGAWAQISQPGEYRFALTRGDRGLEVELAVLRGAAELVNDDGRTPLGAGERAFARAGAAPSYAYVFNSASWDAFDRWSETRRDYRLGLSTQYLPEPVRPYSRAFDRYGSWRHEPQYGYVWYPTVAVSWRPYYHGRWTTLRPWGWVWVGNDPWAWPTHHYGRWGFSAGAWFWIPGRTWGPAWVSWAYTPGYVSWCPLGWNNRPLFSIVNVNVYRGYDPWRGWTVVRRDHFGRDYVHRRVVNWHTLDARSRDLLVKYLGAKGHDVASAESGNRALTSAVAFGPDLILLDVNLPDIDGWGVLDAVRKFSQVPVIMVTARDSAQDKVAGLDLGADDYITKPFSPRELVARVRTVLRRATEPTAGAELIHAGDLTLDRTRYLARLPGREVALTATEFEILAALAGQPGRIFSRAHLLTLVRGVAFESYERAIDSHIRNLRRKIEPAGEEPRYILTVHGVGYKFAE